MAKWYNTGKVKIGYAYVPPVSLNPFSIRA